MTGKLDLSLVIACYNEEPLLEKSVNEIFRILDTTRWNYELIFVDDLSRDKTREIIGRIIGAYKDKRIKKIFHDKNVGRGGTVADGIRIAEGEVVGFIDIDLEVGALYIPSCVMAIKEGYDIATAFRVYKFHLRSLDRYIMSKGYHWLMHKLLGIKLGDTETGFKFFDREKIISLLDEIKDKHWFWDTEVMATAYYKGYRILEVPVLFLRRFDKISSVNNFSDTLEYFEKLWKFRRVLKDKGWG